MEPTELIGIAMQVACTAHYGQTDKAGAPYILHPLRVAGAMPPGDVIGTAVALLHDVAEDADPAMIEPFPEEVRTAVMALTKQPGETYEAFIERVATHPIAKRVKLADLADNMRLDRIAEPTALDLARNARYIAAKARLEG